MSIWGKIAGATAGFAIGGPIGGLIGGLAGHYGVDRGQPDETRTEKAPEYQIAFTIGVIALGAKMAKADGFVSRNEIAAFRQVFRIPPKEARNVERIFNLATRSVIGYDAYARQLSGLFRDRPEVLEAVLDGLFHIAKADQAVHPAEFAYLTSVAEIFGFSDAKFARIRARHIAPDRHDPYVVLGLSPEATDEELRWRYRELAARHHPDKMMARGVPPEFVAIANDRLAAINVAYERIVARRRVDRGMEHADA